MQHVRFLGSLHCAAMQEWQLMQPFSQKKAAAAAAAAAVVTQCMLQHLLCFLWQIYSLLSLQSKMQTYLGAPFTAIVATRSFLAILAVVLFPVVENATLTLSLQGHGTPALQPHMINR